MRWRAEGFTLTLLVATAMLAAQQTRQAPAPSAEGIGRDSCLVCHDLKPSFSHTPHAEAECEDCHGPGSLHMEAGGDDTLTLSLLKPARIVTRCMSCHAATAEVTGFKGGPHGRGGLSCISCHVSHPEKPGLNLLAANRPSTLCGDCHRPERADFRKPFHHPVPEKAMECSDCHRSHSRDLGRENRLELGSKQACVSCHSGKAGPFVFEHAPGALSGCETCHQPHGSANAKMLTRATVFQLCLECHSFSPGAAPSQPPSFHDIRSARFRNCTTCHGAIHGSNVSPIFAR